ncbi:TonB-dependent receptor [Asaia siamensis]
MRSCRSALLLSTAIVSISNSFAHSASPASDEPALQQAHWSTAHKPHKAEEITVSAPSHKTANGVTGQQVGGGLLRRETRAGTIQTVTRDYIAKQSPTSNPVQVLALEPSAYVALMDPYGIVGGNMYLRGLPGDQIGWIYEGVPVSDIGSGGFYANQTSDGDNLQQVSLMPGSVDLSTPAISAAAGSAYATLRDPSHHREGYVNMTYGTYNLARGLIRADTGDIGQSGVRAFASFSYTRANNWRGPGTNMRKHIDFKLVKDIAAHSRTSLVMSYNDNTLQFSRWPTAAEFAQYGAGNDLSRSYKAGLGYHLYELDAFQNLVASAPTELDFGHGLRFHDTPYLWWGSGSIGGAALATEGATYSGSSPVDVDLNGDGRLSKTTSQLVYTPNYYSYHRGGNNASLDWTAGRNTLTLGWWYEWSRLNQATPVSRINPVDGGPENIYGDYGPLIYRTTSGQKWYASDYNTFTQINMLYLGDRLSLLRDRLEVKAGLRAAMVSRGVDSYVPVSTPRRGQNVFEPLPQISARYQIDKHSELYVLGVTNFRTTNNSTLFELYSPAGGALQSAPSNVKPEYSIEEELGYRYHDDLVVGEISFFNYNFTNRQLALNSYVNGALTPMTLNAGGQTSRGVDVQIGTRPILKHLRPYASFEYLDARIDNNIPINGDLLPTSGKHAVSAPKYQAALGLDWDDGSFFANLGLKYIGAQYATLMNDERMPAYINNNVTLGYRLHQTGFLHSPQLQINMQNMIGSIYRNAVYAFTPNAKTVQGIYGTSIAGSSPLYTIQPTFAISVSLSTGF